MTDEFFQMAPDGPVCACGKPSTHESGWCGECESGCFLDEIIEERTKLNPEFPDLVEKASKARGGAWWRHMLDLGEDD